jgi:WhiB family redox-sensing transcriptional regulator
MVKVVSAWAADQPAADQPAAAIGADATYHTSFEPFNPAVSVAGQSMAWLAYAACRDSDPDLFFADTDVGSVRAQVEAAKKVCRPCPVRGTCLSWALDYGPEAGIWGGTTEEERRRLRRRRRPPG